MGRSAQADIRLREEAASREQLVFLLSPEGWVMQNRSANGTEVNGKRYKRDQKILLETGDILGVGQQTRILYVSPEDDPQQAMAERGLEPTQPTPSTPPPPPSERPGRPEPMDSPEAPAGGQMGTEDADDPDEQRKKSKTRKYIIFGAIYLVVLVGLIAFFATRGGEETVDDEGMPQMLSESEIEQAVERDLNVKVQVNPLRADRTLRQARASYRNRERVGNLARAIKYFKLHLKYLGSPAFERAQDGKMFRDAKEQFTTRLIERYRQAYVSSQRERWKDAVRGFETVREMVTPFASPPMPDSDNIVWVNVLEHLRYVRRKMAEEKRR